MAISVASTVVMALVLAERRDLHAPIGYIAIGWTVATAVPVAAAFSQVGEFSFILGSVSGNLGLIDDAGAAAAQRHELRARLYAAPPGA